MSTWYKHFAEHYSQRRAKATVVQYRQGARRFDEFLSIMKRDVTQVEPSDLDLYVKWMVHNEYKTASIKNYVTIAKLYVKWININAGIVTEVMNAPVLPREGKKRIEILPDKLLPAYEDACRTYLKEPFLTALYLLPMTGLRVSEMCKLAIKDVEIHGPSEEIPEGAAQIHVVGKGNKYRKVPVLIDGIEILVHYLVNERPQMISSRWLFPHSRNKKAPIQRTQVNARLTMIKQKLGLSRLYPHLLRHTYGTVLNEAGVSGFDLADVMGHTDLKVTSIYVHPVNSRVLKDVSQISYRKGNGHGGS